MELSISERIVYKSLQAQYPDKPVAPHVLRSEQTLTNSDSTLIFPVLEDGTVPLKTEIRLNKNDILFMTSIGLFIYEKVANQEGLGVLQTYPAELGFTTTAGFTKPHLETVYNGVLRMQIGSTEYIPGLDCRHFRYVPQTQQSSVTNKSQADEESGMFALPTHYKLRGTDQIQISLKQPFFTGIQIANTGAGLANQAVLKCRGFIIRGGAGL